MTAGGRATRLLYRAALWVLILLVLPAVPLLLLEGALRWMDYGETTRFLLSHEINGETWYTPNRAFYQQFSALPLDRIMTWDDLDFQVPAVKAPDSCRIFVFGSSAIYGPRTSSRILEVMLRAHAPDTRWEVYNAACPGMNSHVMRVAARACARLEPDLYLVYMGNNEAVGPFGPTTLLGASRLLWRPSVIRALIALNDLRIVQLLRGTDRGAALNLPDSDALMRALPGMTDHQRALEYYARNVEALCNAAGEAGAPVLLCTLSGNRRYRGLTQPVEVDGESDINRTLRRTAEAYAHAYLADVAAAIAAHSEDELPGYDYFVDNVHFNFEGNYLAAAAMFEALLPVLPRTGAGTPRHDAPLTREACAARLAWTEAAELDLLNWQMQAFQDDYSGARIRARHARLEEQLGDDWRAQLARDHGAALDFHEEDLHLRHHYFRLLLQLGRAEAATVQARLLNEYHPAARVALRADGLAAEARGAGQAARQGYEHCLAHYPDDPEALRRLAELLFQEGAVEQAHSLYRRLLRIDSTDDFTWCRIGQIHAHRGQLRQAADIYRTRIDLAPRHPLAFRLLDEIMAQSDTPAARAKFWDDVMMRHPEAAEAYVRRGLLHEIQGDGEAALALFRQAVDLAPGDPVGWQLLGRAAAARDDHVEAVRAFREAMRINPADDGTRALLDKAIRDAQGRAEEDPMGDGEPTEDHH